MEVVWSYRPEKIFNTGSIEGNGNHDAVWLTYPPMHIENVDVVGLEFHQRVSDGKIHGEFVVPRVVGPVAFADLPIAIMSGISGREGEQRTLYA